MRIVSVISISVLLLRPALPSGIHRSIAMATLNLHLLILSTVRLAIEQASGISSQVLDQRGDVRPQVFPPRALPQVQRLGRHVFRGVKVVLAVSVETRYRIGQVAAGGGAVRAALGATLVLDDLVLRVGCEKLVCCVGVRERQASLVHWVWVAHAAVGSGKGTWGCRGDGVVCCFCHWRLHAAAQAVLGDIFGKQLGAWIGSHLQNINKNYKRSCYYSTTKWHIMLCAPTNVQSVHSAVRASEP